MADIPTGVYDQRLDRNSSYAGGYSFQSAHVGDSFLSLFYIPTSREALSAPIVRKNEYMVMVRMKTNKKLIKN